MATHERSDVAPQHQAAVQLHHAHDHHEHEKHHEEEKHHEHHGIKEHIEHPFSHGGHRSFKERVQSPFPHLREKLKNTHLYDLKIQATHFKHKAGKFTNIVNPNHRHDEEHEKATDEKRSRISESHRFESFAPERDGNNIKWYVDGQDYFWAVSVALEAAKETIYIMDWWLSPELFLRRPPYFNQEWRLDQVLKRKAEAGVKIYVIVYREVEAALTCNSQHTKHALQALCPEGKPGHGNIIVMRHPDHNVLENASDMTFYWAHHEKLLLIDYEVAFFGGLDLCFGRWDQRQHPLSDVHPAGIQHEVFPGQDFNNNRILDFAGVDDWGSNQLSKAEYGRMPWHDVSMGMMGPCVYDLAEHFVLRWNFCKRDKYKRDKEYPWLVLEGRSGEDEDLIGVQRPKFPVGGYTHHPLSSLSTKELHEQGTVHAQVVRSSSDWSSGILTEHSIQNAYCQIIQNAQHYVYIENQFFITATGEEQAPVQNLIGKAIVEACVRAGKEGRKFRIIVVIPAIPGFAGDLREDAAIGTRAIMDYQYKSILRGEHSIKERIKAEGVNPDDYLFFFNLRSYDRLNATSAMRDQEEKSGIKYQEVQQAEAEEIMGTGVHDDTSSTSSSDTDSGDEARQHAVDRKRRFEAHRESAGLNESKSTEDSIAKNAMLNTPKVSKEPWDKDDAEGELANFFQEELYIHAKVCIADDRIAICGSANLNDRSQLGIHDSEIAVVMEDTRVLDSTMDGQPFQAGYHAATLRRLLWREHLGLLPPQELNDKEDDNRLPPGMAGNDVFEGREYELVADPLADKVWGMWTESATVNTGVFRDLFHADPDDSIRTFEQYEEFTPNPKKDKEHKQGHLYVKDLSPEQVKKRLDKVQGHLVWMPMDFLCEAEMAEKGLQVNSITESVYT
ncbi:putative phospholipase PldA [Trichodelitschia bisporula]|uniref:Phospholipase n=1 Tax=Trichodelitschia bisporula TaxID=703511 RepID=A0A6G1I1G8_9PEZI|nr:putative phospholipase PldA [Trichodelitschia bisporula]